MTTIIQPAVPTDVQKGIVGTQVIRWQGSIEAYIDEDYTEVWKGGSRAGAETIIAKPTIIDLPANIPIWPNLDDLITIVRSGVVARFSQTAPHSYNYKVRSIDGGLLMLGKLRIQTVLS